MSELSLPRRRGRAPLVSEAEPFEQLTQNAPAVLQRRLCRQTESLPGVHQGAALRCVSGTRAWHLSPVIAHGPMEAFLAGTEFAHLHPVYDGSVHARLPAPVAAEAVANGWGRIEPESGSVLLFGPRDGAETEVVWGLILHAYRHANGIPG